MLSAKRFKLSVLILLVLIALLSTTIMVSAQDAPAGSLVLMGFNVTYAGSAYNSATDQTTFVYNVAGTGVPPDLSHFDLEIPVCAPALIVVGYTPTDAVSFGTDPTTGVNGIKWDLPLKVDQVRTYSIVFDGNVAEGSVQVAVKGPSFEIGTIIGPSCVVGAVDMDKFVSSDGVNWDEADDAPGLEIEEGAEVWFRLVVTNIGNVDLGNFSLTDSITDTGGCALPDMLEPGESFDCILGPFEAIEGQFVNSATVVGEFDGGTTTDTDDAYYFSGDLPLVAIDKFVSPDGGANWVDSTQVVIGDDVSFKFAVTNTGNVALMGFTLDDSVFDTSGCALPDVLEPDATFECVIGPFPAGETAHTNTATVSAVFEGQTVSDSDTASYQPIEEQAELPVVIVIQGPVEAIIGNIIIIFGMEIQLPEGDPMLTVIKVGDIIRIQGNMADTATVIVVVAVNITVINIEIPTLIFTQGRPQPGGPFVVPAGCKITGIGNNNPRLKCSRRSGR